jgi:hypothetical protein
MTTDLPKVLSTIAQELSHPQQDALFNIILGPTGISSSGFPFIAEKNFISFLAVVPHLFSAGETLLTWLTALESKLKLLSDTNLESTKSALRSIKVLQNIVQTAAVTAPADLWVMRQILSTHRSMGLVSQFFSSSSIDLSIVAEEVGINKNYLKFDFQFLCSRGILREVKGRYALPVASYLRSPLTDLPAIPENEKDTDWYNLFVRWFAGKSTSQESERIDQFLGTDFPLVPAHGWWATPSDIEIGYRIVPLVLAMHYSGFTASLSAGVPLASLFSENAASMQKILTKAGYCNSACGITALGIRVFKKGPGPFGIIHAYRSYFVHHADLLQGKPATSWVSRGENVAASQEANRETFKSANSALDRFAEKWAFKYRIFIEHAVGQGEATRQRFELQGEATTQYFGADLEDAAIDRAVALQQDKKLPKNMIFIRGADIGIPDRLIDAIRAGGFQPEGAVMLVGNGFHEVRNQTNEKMIRVFSEYCQAEILVLFTEESALSDEDLLATGWNTYHAGFRYVHDISGQGLRPALDDESSKKYSWKKCAELGGYQVLQEFTTRTRTIYPNPRTDGHNPSISVNYFCVPKKICRILGIPTE